jgi:3-deoxy-7-phosphoheptulonate synthase
MLIVMRASATQEQVDRVCRAIENMGFTPAPMPGGARTAIGVVGNDRRLDAAPVSGLPGVVEVIHVTAPYKQVSREWKADATVIELDNGVRIGGGELVVMGGPCAVEGEGPLMDAAEAVAAAGARVLRGGAFKPRTSPYSFQGMGEDGLKLLAAARDRFGLAIVTEAIDPESAKLVAEYADIVQIGARNMQNFALLKTVGTLGRPVLLKRGMSATIKEWLLAAEYVVDAGNEQVMLCERGIRSFDPATRNVLDVSAIAIAKATSHLPVIADPSHATGKRALVAPAARASVAAGADGLIVETHPRPHEALSDGPQALLPDAFAQLVRDVRGIHAVLSA